MKLHTMFLRTGCILPDGLELIQAPFGQAWMAVEDTMSGALDVKVRNEGWHFVWLEDACSRFGVGRTAASAVDKAITHALNRIKGRFNAAELDSVRVSKFPGFQVAKIRLHARHIQPQVLLSEIDEITLRHLAAH